MKYVQRKGRFFIYRNKLEQQIGGREFHQSGGGPEELVSLEHEDIR